MDRGYRAGEPAVPLAPGSNITLRTTEPMKSSSAPMDVPRERVDDVPRSG
jgi:hypothetical protein